MCAAWRAVVGRDVVLFGDGKNQLSLGDGEVRDSGTDGRDTCAAVSRVGLENHRMV
jgi:hypothetical protein